MTKSEFLTALQHGLKRLYAKEEIDGVLGYYDELLSDMIEGGMTEQEAVQSFGDIHEVIERAKYEMLADVSKRTDFATAKIILTVLASPVLFPILLCAIVVYLVYVSVAFGLIVGFGCGGVAAILYGIVMFVAVMGASGFGVALAYLGFGLTVGSVLCILTVLLCKFSIWLLRSINRMFIGSIKKKSGARAQGGKE